MPFICGGNVLLKLKKPWCDGACKIFMFPCKEKASGEINIFWTFYKNDKIDNSSATQECLLWSWWRCSLVCIKVQRSQASLKVSILIQSRVQRPADSTRKNVSRDISLGENYFGSLRHSPLSEPNPAKMTLNFDILGGETKARLLAAFPGYSEGFVRCQPGNLLMPLFFKKDWQTYFNFQLRNEDVFILSFPKSGKGKKKIKHVTFCLLGDR